MEIISKNYLFQLKKEKDLDLQAWFIYVNTRLVGSVINEMDYCFIRDWRSYNGDKVLEELGYEVLIVGDSLKVYHGIKF